FSELNKALQIWTSQAVAARLPLTNTILQQKGLELIRFLGEASSAPLTTLPEEQLKLRNLLAAYNEKDIYNTDEMELFFK
ncbi:hypothetical protein RhiirB3_458110, partial [Rhizophagus irregularis]